MNISFYKPFVWHHLNLVSMLWCVWNCCYPCCCINFPSKGNTFFNTDNMNTRLLIVWSHCNVVTISSTVWKLQRLNIDQIRTHKRHPISHPHGWAMGCLLWVFWRNWLCYITQYILAPCFVRSTVMIRSPYTSRFLASLTQWGRDKMDVISQSILSNAFSWIKMLKFRLKFHWILFLGVQLIIFQHWFR